MHRHAAARLNLTSAIELSHCDLNTAGQAWVHGRVGYNDDFQIMV